MLYRNIIQIASTMGPSGIHIGPLTVYACRLPLHGGMLRYPGEIKCKKLNLCVVLPYPMGP